MGQKQSIFLAVLLAVANGGRTLGVDPSVPNQVLVRADYAGWHFASPNQQSFMLPWEVYDGAKQFTSGNADISRAVAQMLPPGFLHRERLSGDLLRMIVDQFPQLARVQEFIKKSMLEHGVIDRY